MGWIWWIWIISKFDERFIKNYHEKSDEGYFLEVDVQCLEKLNNLRNDLPPFFERMKIEKVKNLVAHFHDKIEYVIHRKKLKTSIKSWISFEKSS